MADALSLAGAPEPLFRLQRALRRASRGLRNRARSILRDALFVDAAWQRASAAALSSASAASSSAASSSSASSSAAASSVAAPLPLFLNARAGSFYHPAPSGACYFKSTDGHPSSWAFAATRLNLHVASAAARAGGACVADASQSHKRAPDSLSRTLPLWAAVLNAVVLGAALPSPALALPPHIAPSERDAIAAVARAAVADMAPELRATIVAVLRPVLRAPLRCFWLDQAGLAEAAEAAAASDIFEEEGARGTAAAAAAACFDPAPQCSDEARLRSIAARWRDSRAAGGEGPRDGGAAAAGSLLRCAAAAGCDVPLLPPPGSRDLSEGGTCTPLLLISASKPSRSSADLHAARSGWDYLPGAADDAESWAGGLQPAAFWAQLPALLDCDTDAACAALVHDGAAAGGDAGCSATLLRGYADLGGGDAGGGSGAAAAVRRVEWDGRVIDVHVCADDGDDGVTAAVAGAAAGAAACAHGAAAPALRIRVRAAASRDEAKREFSRWQQRQPLAGAAASSAHDLLYTAPVGTVQCGACRTLAQLHILPHLLAAVERRRDGAAAAPPPPLFLVSPAAAHFASIMAAAVLLAGGGGSAAPAGAGAGAEPSARLSKPRMRACIAAVQLALGIGSLPRELEKELAKFLQLPQQPLPVGRAPAEASPID